MTDARRPAALLLLVALAGCSTIAPFEAAQPADNQYAVCYNRMGATPQQVRSIAGLECTGGAKPHLLRQEMNLSACPLLTPMRAIYACVAPGAQPAP